MHLTPNTIPAHSINDGTYLGLRLVRRLKFASVLGNKSALNTSTKVEVHKAIIRSTVTYRALIWCSVVYSNLLVLERTTLN